MKPSRIWRCARGRDFVRSGDGVLLYESGKTGGRGRRERRNPIYIYIYISSTDPERPLSLAMGRNEGNRSEGWR